jgi:hypothetical protein
MQLRHISMWLLIHVRGPLTMRVRVPMLRRQCRPRYAAAPIYPSPPYTFMANLLCQLVCLWFVACADHCLRQHLPMYARPMCGRVLVSTTLPAICRQRLL